MTLKKDEELETPKGLTALEYARHILEEVLGWPAKGNLEMMADCLTSLSKSRRMDLVKAHGYMVRAIGLAKEQSTIVDRWFFQYGSYTTVRPTKAAMYQEKTPRNWLLDLGEKERKRMMELAAKKVMP